MRRRWKRFKIGDERTREFFAWWPVTIRQEHAAETRWLETVRVLEKWTEFKAGEQFWPQRFLGESNSNAGERTFPTLTDAEREAVDTAEASLMRESTDLNTPLPVRQRLGAAAATLRGLLERLGGGT